jgi:N-acetylneuraminate lyase
MSIKLHGLVAATHTPFFPDGALNLGVVEKQAEHLLADGAKAVFIGGSTGECHSLSVEERLALAQRWSEVVAGTGLQLVVHTGANCLADARTLAMQAQSLGADAIAAMAPCYFKPATLELLVACCGEIAAAAGSLPFYFYDIPTMTGVRFSMPEFLAAAAERIPTLAGIKFTNNDLAAYLSCLHSHGGRFDIPWGVDEYLLAALALGAAGGVGSSYNFAAPLYHRVMEAFARGAMSDARTEQHRAVQLIALLYRFGYLAAAKAVMGFLGVAVGPARLPNANLTQEDGARLRSSLEQLGFFDWIRPGPER